jgi:hypothetical protein
LTLPVALLETLLGVALFVNPVARFAAAGSVVLLAVFALGLLTSPSLVNGCGCWGGPEKEPPAYAFLIRNAILGGLAIIGTFGLHPTDAWNSIVVATVSIPVAFLVMELPTFFTIVRSLELSSRDLRLG